MMKNVIQLFRKRSDRDIDAIYRSLRRDAILFTHVFPPQHGKKSSCFFGGRPQLPPDIDWPAIGGDENGLERSLSLLAQIDCASLPRLDNCPDLPEAGTLFFFVDSMDALCFDHQDFRNWVIYHPEPVTTLPPTPDPADLQYCEGDPLIYGHQYDWLNHLDRTERDFPKNYPKWAVEPHRIDAARTVGYEEFDHQTGTYLSDRIENDLHSELMRVQGGLIERTWDYYFFPEGLDARTAFWRPHPSFPHAWIQVEIFAGYFCEEINDDPKYDKERQQAYRWASRGRAAGLFTATSPEDREAFWSWLQAMEESASSSAESVQRDKRDATTLNRCISRAYQKGIDFCLAESAIAAAQVDNQMIDDVRWRHVPIFEMRNEIDTVRHAMCGAAKEIQFAPQRFKDTHMLLMQFDSDYGMGWMWGDVGVLQYWIRPDDLKSRRFENVIVTMEGH